MVPIVCSVLLSLVTGKKRNFFIAFLLLRPLTAAHSLEHGFLGVN